MRFTITFVAVAAAVIVVFGVSASTAAADSCPVAEAGIFWRMLTATGVDAQANGVKADISRHDHSFISNCIVWGDRVSAAMGQTTRLLLNATSGNYVEFGWKLKINTQGGHYSAPFSESVWGGNGYQNNYGPNDVPCLNSVNTGWNVTTSYQEELFSTGATTMANDYYNCGGGLVLLDTIDAYGATWGSPEGEVFHRGSSGVLGETQRTMTYRSISTGAWTVASNVRCRRDTSNSTWTPGLAHYYSARGGASQGLPSGFDIVDQGTAGSVDCGKAE